MSFEEENDDSVEKYEGDLLHDDEGTRLVRAQRLARARKNALAVGLGRVDERDSLHRSMKHSSIRAEVGQLTDQIKNKEGDLKEARLYIQRLEARLRQNKASENNSSSNKEEEEEKRGGGHKGGEMMDLKKKNRALERANQNLRQTAQLELTRLQQLLIGAERLVENNYDSGSGNGSEGRVVGGSRSLQGLLLKARHGMVNLNRIIGLADANTDADAVSGKMTGESKKQGHGDHDADHDADADGADVDVENTVNVSWSSSSVTNAAHFVNSHRSLLSSQQTQTQTQGQTHGQIQGLGLMDELLEMCQVLETENLRLQSVQSSHRGHSSHDQHQHQHPQQQEGKSLKGKKSTAGSGSGIETTADAQVQIEQLRRLVSHYRTAIVGLQNDFAACQESLLYEKDLSKAVKAQLAALHRTGVSLSTTTGAASARLSKERSQHYHSFSPSRSRSPSRDPSGTIYVSTAMATTTPDFGLNQDKFNKETEKEKDKELDTSIVQKELAALDIEIDTLRKKLRVAALEKTSSLVSSALGTLP